MKDAFTIDDIKKAMDFISLFKKYEDRLRARKVFMEYVPDISRYDLYSEALTILEECSTSSELEVKLCVLIDGREKTLTAHPARCFIEEDIDSFGYSSVARKILEDGRQMGVYIKNGGKNE